MKYINIENGTWIEFNEQTKQSRTIEKYDLEQEILFLTEQNSKLNKTTDEELLEWAKENYRGSKEAMEFQRNKKKINELEDLIDKLI